MISEELRDIVKGMEEKGNNCFLEGATEEQITEFEGNAGIQFPEQFREWLLFSDGGECYLPEGVQFYGVAHQPVIDVEDDDRPDDGYIVIGALSMGDPILCEKDSDRISIYNLEAGRIEEDESYPDFFSFLRDLENIIGLEE